MSVKVFHVFYVGYDSFFSDQSCDCQYHPQYVFDIRILPTISCTMICLMHVCCLLSSVLLYDTCLNFISESIWHNFRAVLLWSQSLIVIGWCVWFANNCTAWALYTCQPEGCKISSIMQLFCFWLRSSNIFIQPTIKINGLSLLAQMLPCVVPRITLYVDTYQRFERVCFCNTYH
jgi:hypothetical protein